MNPTQLSCLRESATELEGLAENAKLIAADLEQLVRSLREAREPGLYVCTRGCGRTDWAELVDAEFQCESCQADGVVALSRARIGAIVVAAYRAAAALRSVRGFGHGIVRQAMDEADRQLCSALGLQETKRT
jgi:hypothetical protein